MAVTTGARTGVTRWSAATDPFTRAQMDASHQSVEDNMAIDAQGTLAARPAAAIRGRYYWATDQGILYRDNGSAWFALSPPKTLRTAHGFAVPGDILAPVGEDNIIPGFFYNEPAGQTGVLVAARHRIRSGTSVTLGIYVNGTLQGATFTVTPTPSTYDIPDVALADGDYIEITQSAPSGSPKNLSCTLFIDNTI